MYNRAFICVIFTLLLLTGCGRTDTCLEPDDFGFAKATISSRYDPTMLFGTQENEIAPWLDDGLVLDGNPLYIMVKNWRYPIDDNAAGIVSAWCPWYGDEDHDRTLTKFCERLPPCNFKGAENCYDASGNPTSNGCITKAMCTDTRDAQLTNAPCLMTKGVGLYALLTKKGYDPNLSINTITAPDGITMHLGDPHVGYVIPSMSNDGSTSNAGGILYDYDGSHGLNSSRLQYINGKIYLKILDHFYDDNNGQYRVFVKSGVVNGGWDPISWCIELVKTALFGVNPAGSVEMNYGSGGSGIVPVIYSSIIAQSAFVNAVRASLTLYVIFSAIGFLLGSLELTQKELLHRVFKITVIVALISPASWDFFNKNLFIWFYEGTGFVINILMDVAAAGPGSTNPLSFFFSEEIFIKLSSLLFATPTGWIYIIIYLIMLIFLVIIYFDAAVIYMTALIMMGVLISIAPIFIALYLFEQTKSFFDNWLKQLMGYAVQMILVYAGILFMTMIIRNQIYNTLGFPTCAIEFPNVGGITIFKWYFPKIQSWGDNPQQALIPVPKDHFQTPQDSTLAFGFSQASLTDSDFCKANPNLCNNINNPQVGAFCPAYGCLGSRYPDLPFLDPNDDYESKLINQIRGGYIGDFSGLAIIVICIYLMDHFNKSTVSMAKFLSNTLANQGDNARAAASASAGLKSMAMQPVHYADKRLGVSAAAGSARDKVHDFFAQAKYKMIDKPWADYKTGSLKEDALSDSRWTKAMRRGAENSTGMSFKEATSFNSQYKKGLYTSALHESISASTGRSDTGTAGATKQILERLSKGKAENFKDIAAQELFKDYAQYRGLKGKIDYSKLSADDKKMVDKLSGTDQVKKLLDAKTKQEMFQDAYVKSYINMSDEGRGFLQKRSSVLRWGQDVKNRMDANIQREEQERMLKGEHRISKYDNMKRLISGGLIGSERSQILYNDSHMRTMDEQMYSTLTEKNHQEITRELNRAIVKEGRDIQRPDAGSDKYQSLIDEHLSSSVRQELRFADREGKKALLMGDTYMKTKMSDSGLKEMIDQMNAKEQQILEADSYLKDTAQYAGNQAALDKLEARAKTIHDTVQAEIERVNEIRVGRGMEAYGGRSHKGEQYGYEQKGPPSRNIDSEGPDASSDYSQQAYPDTSEARSGTTRKPSSSYGEDTGSAEESYRGTAASSNDPFKSAGHESSHQTENLSSGSSEAAHETRPEEQSHITEAPEVVSGTDTSSGKYSTMNVTRQDTMNIDLSRENKIKGIDEMLGETTETTKSEPGKDNKYKYEEPAAKKPESSEAATNTTGPSRSGNADTPEVTDASKPVQSMRTPPKPKPK